MEKGGFLQNILFSFCQNFMKIHGCILFKSFVMCPLFLFILQIDASKPRKKGVSSKIPIFANISFSFCQNFNKLYNYITYSKFHHVLFIYVQNFVTRKWCLMSFTLGFGFLDSQIKDFPFS